MTKEEKYAEAHRMLTRIIEILDDIEHQLEERVFAEAVWM
jgi:hypothetical protein